MDAAEAKSREFKSWTQVAPGWKKHDARLVRAGAPAADRMLDMARIGKGHRVLDIASGTGEPALPAAERVGPTGHVLGTDFVEEMLAFAREKAAQRGLTNVEFRRVDGEELDVPADSFDAVTCRWGLMFMPDPLACLERAYRALKSGGRIAVACWTGPERNPFVAVPLGVLKRHIEVPTPAPEAPGIFSFADATRLRTTLETAGFKEIEIVEVPAAMAEFDTGADFFNYIRELAGPVATLFSQLPADKQKIVAAEVASEAERHREGKQVVLKGVTWVAAGTK